MEQQIIDAQLKAAALGGGIGGIIMGLFFFCAVYYGFVRGDDNREQNYSRFLSGAMIGSSLLVAFSAFRGFI